MLKKLPDFLMVAAVTCFIVAIICALASLVDNSNIDYLFLAAGLMFASAGLTLFHDWIRPRIEQ